MGPAHVRFEPGGARCPRRKSGSGIACVRRRSGRSPPPPESVRSFPGATGRRSRGRTRSPAARGGLARMRLYRLRATWGALACRSAPPAFRSTRGSVRTEGAESCRTTLRCRAPRVPPNRPRTGARPPAPRPEDARAGALRTRARWCATRPPAGHPGRAPPGCPEFPYLRGRAQLPHPAPNSLAARAARSRWRRQSSSSMRSQLSPTIGGRRRTNGWAPMRSRPSR